MNHKAIPPKETCGVGEEHLDSELGVRNITTWPFFLAQTHIFYFSFRHAHTHTHTLTRTHIDPNWAVQQPPALLHLHPSASMSLRPLSLLSPLSLPFLPSLSLPPSLPSSPFLSLTHTYCRHAPHSTGFGVGVGAVVLPVGVGVRVAVLPLEEVLQSGAPLAAHCVWLRYTAVLPP